MINTLRRLLRQRVDARVGIGYIDKHFFMLKTDLGYAETAIIISFQISFLAKVK